VITRLAWVSAAEARDQDPDEALALPALKQAGLEVDVVVWDDPAVPWASYDRAVVRSTWNYPQRLDDFRTWLERVAAATDLRNPLPMLRWNLDKHYLADLEQAGVPVTATVFVEPGAQPALPAGDFVVKPAVGAGSRDAASYADSQHEQARAHVTRLHAEGVTALVQPLVRSVPVEGEWPLVFLGGRYSHAANKRVNLPRARSVEGLFAEETNRPHQADEKQIAVARAAMDVVTARFGVPTYARVDLVRDDSGEPRVLELELVEPSLFLPEGPPEAVDILVEALLG
jgi:glutathione synthase/RimK-type ligase-like ATP-grasp enzyme